MRAEQNARKVILQIPQSDRTEVSQESDTRSGGFMHCAETQRGIHNRALKKLF